MTTKLSDGEIISAIARSQKATNATLRAIIHLKEGQVEELMVALNEATELSVEAAQGLGELAKRVGLIEQGFEEWKADNGR